MPDFSRVCKMLLLYKAALTQIILWEFLESLRQKSSLAPTSISAEKTGWYGNERIKRLEIHG